MPHKTKCHACAEVVEYLMDEDVFVCENCGEYFCKDCTEGGAPAETILPNEFTKSDDCWFCAKCVKQSEEDSGV